MAIEYKIHFGYCPTSSEYVNAVAQQVGEGWELVSVVHVTGGSYHYIFKRQWAVSGGVAHPVFAPTEPPWGATDPNDIDTSGNKK